MTIHQQDILEEILTRLPAKSIGRFRCVSKAWKSLLSQPQFIKTHLNQIKQHPIQEQSLLLVCNKFLYSVKLENAHQVFDEMMITPLLPTMLNLGHYRFSEDNIFDRIASCDGLIVVLDVHNKFMLINPTTREIKALPEPPYVLDRRYSNTIPGIGYDSLNDDYKVVTISFYVDYFRRNDFSYDDDEEEDGMVVNVYSVKNGTWKTVDDSPFDHKAVHAAGGVYCHGHIHWIAKRNSENYTFIAAFDVKEEKFFEVPLPSSVDARQFSLGHLFIAEGSLCFSPYQMDDKHECFVMKEYGVNESWTKVTIPDRDRVGIRPLCLLGEEQMVLLMDEQIQRDYEELDEQKPYEELVLYNVKERAFTGIEIQRFPDDITIKGTFLESLISPHYVYRDEAANEE